MNSDDYGIKLELQAIKDLLQKNIELIGKDIESIKEMQNTHSVIMWGTKEKPDIGITVRLDRIEQAQSQRSWWMRLFGTTIMGLVVERIWHLFNNTMK